MIELAHAVLGAQVLLTEDDEDEVTVDEAIHERGDRVTDGGVGVVDVRVEVASADGSDERIGDAGALFGLGVPSLRA
ncbi:MAG: hypothetical protein R3F65_16815 [bacterium]